MKTEVNQNSLDYFEGNELKNIEHQNENKQQNIIE